MKYFFAFILIILFQKSHAQKDFEAKKNEVLKYIERNFDIDDNKTPSQKPEFFSYIISIDPQGEIQKIRVLSLDSLSHTFQIYQIADSIKAKYKFGKLDISELIIPVLIVHSNDNDNVSDNEKAILRVADFFDSLSKCKIKTTAVSRIAVLSRFENKKRN
jgi:hypothetical protein